METRINCLEVIAEAKKYRDVGKLVSSYGNRYAKQAMVMYIFADELFLKYLLFRYNDRNAAKTHSLY